MKRRKNLFCRAFSTAALLPLFEIPIKMHGSLTSLIYRYLLLNTVKKTFENVVYVLPVLAKSKQNEWVLEFICTNGVTPVLVQGVKIFRQFVNHLFIKDYSVLFPAFFEPLRHFVSLVEQLGT